MMGGVWMELGSWETQAKNREAYKGELQPLKNLPLTAQQVTKLVMNFVVES